MRRTFLALALLLLGSAFAAPGARAVLLYSNPPELGANQEAACAYNTSCGINSFAAQLFTLAQAATVTGVGFNATLLISAGFATSANWQFLDNDGAGGLPGTVLASGSGAALSNTAGPVGANFDTTNYSFAIPATALAAGDYYIAIQAVTTNLFDFLSLGTAGSGAAISGNGGATWISGYAGFPSVAVSLTGEFTAAPEPASLALFGLGLGGLALARRRAQR